jgi:hypothetical protein
MAQYEDVVSMAGRRDVFARAFNTAQAVGGMKIGRGNQSTRSKPASAPLCPPQIPLNQTRD